MIPIHRIKTLMAVRTKTKVVQGGQGRRRNTNNRMLEPRLISKALLIPRQRRSRPTSLVYLLIGNTLTNTRTTTGMLAHTRPSTPWLYSSRCRQISDSTIP
jgi:hypothetical protein